MEFFDKTQIEFDLVDIDLSPNSSLMIDTNLLLNLNGTQIYGEKLQINSKYLILVYTPAPNATERGFLIHYSLNRLYIVNDSSVHTNVSYYAPSSSSLIKPINILTLFIVGMIIMNK
uniref:CUB domain-containing protein n=1 Tax=Acrobeloides nanus TaxID=290746 RepID=A0A914CKF9_9BILA